MPFKSNKLTSETSKEILDVSKLNINKFYGGAKKKNLNLNLNLNLNHLHLKKNHLMNLMLMNRLLQMKKEI